MIGSVIDHIYRQHDNNNNNNNELLLLEHMRVLHMMLDSNMNNITHKNGESAHDIERYYCTLFCCVGGSYREEL